MNHLDVVSGTIITDPLAACLAVRLGRDALEDILDVWPCLLVSSWHDGWAVSGTLLASRNTGSDESDSLPLQVLGAAGGIWVVGVTTVNDDVALLQVWEESLNEVVNWLSGHNQEHDAAWGLELSAELLDGVSTLNGLSCTYISLNCKYCLADNLKLVFLAVSEHTLGLVLEEAVNLADGTVEGNNVESMVGDVQNQVLSHDSETDEAEISTGVARRLTNINAGETCAKVSKIAKINMLVF